SAVQSCAGFATLGTPLLQASRTMPNHDRLDTSSISFTALYTGHVWAANGLSAPAFHTRTGQLFYHALAPFEYLGGKLVGGNIRTFLLQRHHLIDHLVEQAIAE